MHNRYVKSWLKIPNRLKNVVRNRRGGGFFDSHCIQSLLMTASRRHCCRAWVDHTWMSSSLSRGVSLLRKVMQPWLDWIGLSSVLRPRQHSIGYIGDGFYRSKDPTNSIKVLKEHIGPSTQTNHTYNNQTINTKRSHDKWHGTRYWCSIAGDNCCQPRQRTVSHCTSANHASQK